MENLDPQKEILHEIEGDPYYEEIHRKNLEFSRKQIRRSLGIELTNTELIKLSFIIEDVIRKTRQQIKDVKTSFTAVAAFEEVLPRFLYECYGITVEEKNKLFPDEDEKSRELKKKYFQRKQAELYN